MRKIVLFTLVIFSLLFALAEKPKGQLSEKEQTKIELYNKMKNAYKRGMTINFSKAYADYEKYYNRYFSQFENKGDQAEAIRLNLIRLRYQYNYPLEAYLDTFEKDFPGSFRGKADRQFFRGVVLFHQKKYQESERYLKSTVVGAPYYYDAQRMLMNVYEQQGNIKKAIETGEYLLSSGFEKDTKNYQLYKYQIAKLYLQIDEMKKAKVYLNDLKDSVKLPPPIVTDIRRKLRSLN